MLSGYGVYLINQNEGTSTNPNVMFNFDIEQTFDVFVACTDARNTVTNPIPYLRVDIIDNDKVEFTNLPGKASFQFLQRQYYRAQHFTNLLLLYFVTSKGK